jgi:hypothetical protein
MTEINYYHAIPNDRLPIILYPAYDINPLPTLELIVIQSSRLRSRFDFRKSNVRIILL